MFQDMEETDVKTEEATYFDPKIFIESLFKTREAEIEVILNGTSTTNFTNLSDDSIENQKNDKHDKNIDYTPDVYLLIGAVSFIIVVILCLAMYKAVEMLKTSLRDSYDDTIPQPNEPPANNQDQQRPEVVQSVASGYFLNGKIYFVLVNSFKELK